MRAKTRDETDFAADGSGEKTEKGKTGV